MFSGASLSNFYSITMKLKYLLCAVKYVADYVGVLLWRLLVYHAE